MDSGVTGLESQGSGDLRNTVAVTSWNNQEFSDAIRKVKLLSGISSGTKVACWISQEFGNLQNSCSHPLEESGTQWHSMEGCLNFD